MLHHLFLVTYDQYELCLVLAQLHFVACKHMTYKYTHIFIKLGLKKSGIFKWFSVAAIILEIKHLII
jgi:hypothetical protein